MDTVKCNRCLVKLPVIKFETKRCGTLRKLCIDCNLKNKTRFKCADCDAKFSSQKNLQRHIDGVHLKLKPFVCLTCAMKFSENGNLQQHINDVHLQIKSFSCLTCEYKFSSRSNLKRHTKTCTGELKCSGGEYQIMKVLAELNMEKNENYLYDTSFWNVKDKNLLRWDFIVNHNTSPMVIEFDGRQHFRPVTFGGSIEQAQENFEDYKRRDKIKDDHCKENNIPILRISYLDIDNIEKLVKEFLHKDSSVSTT